jgi:hypothetical protein
MVVRFVCVIRVPVCPVFVPAHPDVILPILPCARLSPRTGSPGLFFRRLSDLCEFSHPYVRRSGVLGVEF